MENTALPAPPDNLSESSKELFAEVVAREVESRRLARHEPMPPGRLALIIEALRALDRANQAREELAKTGLTFTTDSGTVHINPLARIEKDAAGQFSRTWVITPPEQGGS